MKSITFQEISKEGILNIGNAIEIMAAAEGLDAHKKCGYTSFKRFAIMNVLDLVRENIKNIKPYSSARDEYKDATSESMIFLDANENPFENGVNRYPDPQQNDVKEVLSTIKNVGKENILLGNGSDEVLDLIFRAFVNQIKITSSHYHQRMGCIVYWQISTLLQIQKCYCHQIFSLRFNKL